MILKFTVGELKALEDYRHHPSSFGSFIEQVYYRTNEATGEVDLDRDDFQRIENFERRGHKKRVEKVFKRPTDAAFRRFFGPRHKDK